MKKAILFYSFLLLSGVSFAQPAVKISLARQLNELFVSSVDSNSNQLVNVDRLGTVNIMFKSQNENIDFNVLDLSKIDLVDRGEEKPDLRILFHCKECMRLSSPIAERKAGFDNSTYELPIKYKAIGLKIVTKLEELKKQNQ